MGQLPENDVAAIFAGVASLGGQWRDQLAKDVTHVVSLAPSGKKYRTAMEHKGKLGFTVVLPHWFDDCFRLRRRITEMPYEFPDPPLMSIDSTTSLPGDSSDFPFALLNTEEDFEKESPSQARCLDGQGVYIASDIDVRPQLLEAIKTRIQHAGGFIADNLDNGPKIYIGMYRSGTDYVKASKKGLTVGSLAWLYHILTSGRLESPLAHLLHYPVAKGAMPGMENAVITISNYTGAAREYLKRLVAACGAKFTPTMSPQNTHLIAAFAQGSKVERASAWNVELVNHYWLEDSYRQWEMKAVSDARYTHFAQAASYSSLVGDAKSGDYLDETVLKRWYASKDEPVVQGTARVLLEKRLQQGPGDEQENTPPSAQIPPSAKKTKTPKAKSVKSAKADLSLADKEHKNKRASPEAEDSSSKTKRARKVRSPVREVELEEDIPDIDSHSDRTIGSDHAALNHKPTKRSKQDIKAKKLQRQASAHQPTSSPASTVNNAGQITVLLTGIDKADKRAAALRHLGARVAEDMPKSGGVTHCVANRIVRTPKFLAALSRGVIIVTEKWIDASVKAKTLVEDVSAYALRDSVTEKKYGFSLADSLAIARDDGPPFEGVTFHVTPSTEPEASTLSKVCQHAGAKISKVAEPKAGQFLNNVDNILISCEKDRKLWESLVDQGVKVYTPEVILTGLLRQKLERDEHILAE